ncbi:unnamed protein product [Closterium sp. Naga37s-1]|nr:unnamed protein product [Closterium sp. Naga37s-1]
MNLVWFYPSRDGQPMGSNPAPAGSAQVDYSCNGLMTGDATVMAPAPAPSTDSPSPPPPPASTTPSPPPPSTVTPPSKGVLCPASTFSGYEYQLELGSGNYLLHWKFASNTVINFLIEARSNTIIKDAWMAVGWSSKKGKMKGSDAVIGNLPGVGAFYMNGYRLKNIQQTTAFSLGTTSVSTTSEGGTSIAFSRTVGSGNVPLKLNTTSYLIWAFAQTVSKTLYFHGMNQVLEGVLGVLGGAGSAGSAGREGLLSGFKSVHGDDGRAGSDSRGGRDGITCMPVPQPLWGGGPDYRDDSDADKDYSGGPWQGASLPTDAAAAGDAAGLTASLVDQGQSSSAAGTAGTAAGDAGAANRKSGVRFYDGAAGRISPPFPSRPSPSAYSLSAHPPFRHLPPSPLPPAWFCTGRPPPGLPSRRSCRPRQQAPLPFRLSPSAPPLPPLPFRPSSSASLVLHWKATTGTTVDMELQATSAGASGGWFAVGWSSGGKMYPADAVIAHKAGADIGAYTITGYDSSNVASTTAFSLGSPAYSAGAATYVYKFSRTVGTGSKVTFVNGPITTIWAYSDGPSPTPLFPFPLNSFSRTVGTGSKVTFVNGPMKTIWAYSDGATTSFDGHGGNRGSTTIDFSCDGTPVATPSPPPASANPSPPPPPASSASPPPPASSASPPPPTATPSPPPAPPAAGVACPASALEGFDYQVELGGPLMLLHWTFSTSTTIKFSIEARGATIAKDGWIAVGWSGNKGKMKGSDAVIGNLPGVAAVHMSGYSKKLVKQTSAFTIGDTAVATTSEGGTTITFTREVGKGAVPIKLNATNYLIYAFSTTASTTLAFHGWNQGGLAVDFSCFKKPSALWGGGPDYSDDSDYDNSFRSARAASMDGTSTSSAGTSSADSATGGALSSGRRNRLHQQTGLGHQHHESAAGTTAGVAGDGAVGTGVGMTNADWWTRRSGFWKTVFGG